LAGRIKVKVSTINGDIKVGDLLTSSSIPGVAVRASGSGPIIGKALESYNGSEQGLILAFIKVSWNNLGDQTTTDNNGTDNNGNVAYLVEAIKDLKKQNDEFKAQNEAQQAQIGELKAQVEALQRK
jgi:hypothetical protein